MTLSIFDANSKYTMAKSPSTPMRGCAMMKAQINDKGASATAKEGKSCATEIRWY
jgi:hypothetical protein